MQKKILFIILSFIIFQKSSGQEAIAKLKFGDAEEAYENGDYVTALSKLDDAETILGEKNIQKILYLRIMAQHKLLENNNDEINLEQIAMLRDNCKIYLEANEHNEKIVEKYKDVYKTQEVYKAYEPFDKIVMEANKGNTKSMVELGKIYWRSLENSKKAKDWLLQAKQKEVAAIRILGQIEREGDEANNVESDYKKSLDYLLEASKKGDPIAIYNASQFYEFPKRFDNIIPQDTILAKKYYDKSFKEGLKLAEEGNDEMMNLLGILYASKKTIEYDKKKSFSWYSKAAEKNNILSIRTLARAYQYGGYEETPKNIEKAIFYYEMAVKNGDFKSMESLAYIYGNTEPVNHKKSLEWYQKAADNGLAFSMYKVAEAYSSGKNDITPDSKAITWATKAAKKGNSDAMLLLANCYYEGWNVTKNFDTAKDWYEKSATKKNRLACLTLARLYLSELEGFSKDYNKALQWYLQGVELHDDDCLYEIPFVYLELKQYDKALLYFTKGADKGFRGSLYEIGELYYKGLGVQKNDEKAFSYFSQSAEKEWKPAMQMLAVLYKNGDGVKKDKKLAAEWLAKAEKIQN